MPTAGLPLRPLTVGWVWNSLAIALPPTGLGGPQHRKDALWTLLVKASFSGPSLDFWQKLLNFTFQRVDNIFEFAAFPL